MVHDIHKGRYCCSLVCSMAYVVVLNIMSYILWNFIGKQKWISYVLYKSPIFHELSYV